MADYISSLFINYKDTKQLKYGVNNICDNTIYYGSTTWSVINNGGITGLAVDGSQYTGVTLSENNAKYLVITNEYTGTTSDPVITVKASSDLVSCDTNNTCKITLKRACWRQPVIFELVINDDSKKYTTSITGYNNLWWGKSSSSISIGYAGKISINDNNIENGICNYITTEDTTIHGNCNSALSSGDKIYFSFHDININASLKNNVQNVSVSGEVKYKFGDDTYTTLDSLSSDIYTYTSTSNSINITGCNYKTTQLHDLMDGFKTLYIKHIINLKYDNVVTKDYCPSVSIELYDNSNNVISGTSTTGNNINIKITINNWKDIPESNKKKFDSFENGGNNITYSLPTGYIMGLNAWDDDNNFKIIGGLPDECPEGDYTFSVTVCDNTVSKTTTKSITHQELPCPDFYVSESDFTIYPYESKIIRLHINNWNSTTTITDHTFTKYFEIVSITKTNMTYSVGSYNHIDEYYPITITHEFNETNDSSDKLDITIYSKNDNCDNSANIKCHLKLGYFNVTFNTNGAIPFGKYVEVFIDCNGVKQRVAAITGTTSPLNQRTMSIWHSALDTGSNAGKCPSRSFTVFIGGSNVTNAVITSATSGTIDNTCKSDDFNITCDVIF